MVQPGTLRYRGFEPWEISRLQNEFVLLEHAEAASTKWVLRAKAVDSARYDLVDLAKLDAKLEAQLDALCLSMQYGPQLGVGLCEAQFQDLLGRGEAFAATYMAANFAHAPMLDSLCVGIDEDPELAPAMCSALGWSSWDAAWPVIDVLWRSEIELRRIIALAGVSFHLRDPTVMVDEAINASELRLRARAARTIGDLGIGTRSDILRPLVHDSAAEVRFFAARSLLLLGARDDEVSRALSELAEGGDAWGVEAGCLLMRVMPEAAAQAWFNRLSSLGVPLCAIAGAGAQGSPSFVPLLIDRMADDELAVAAGAALTMITGVDLEREDLDREPPDSAEQAEEDDDGDEQADAQGPHPDAELVRAWWAKVEHDFTAGHRYLAGQPINPSNLARVLGHANQLHRHAAGIEAVLAAPGSPLYRTRQSGLTQARELLGWS